MTRPRTLEGWAKILTFAGSILGALVIGYGIWTYASTGVIPPLLISLAVLVAGPVEGILKNRLGRRHSEDPAVKLVDWATTIGFLVLLLLAQYLSREHERS